MDKGQVAAQGPIDELKGPAGRVFELRVKGDLPGFLEVLRQAGMECHAHRRGRDAGVRAGRPGGAVRPRRRSAGHLRRRPRSSASRCGTSGRACRRSRTSSPRRSARRLADADSRPELPPLRRRQGHARAAPGRSSRRPGIRTMLRKRAFLGVLLFAWGPFIVRAVQIYVTTNYAQVAAAFGGDRADLPRLPRRSRTSSSSSSRSTSAPA